jgi:hypothetical protein
VPRPGPARQVADLAGELLAMPLPRDRPLWEALYSGGARVLADHIFGPIVEGVSLSITVLSYRNSTDVGIVASPDLTPDPWRIADAMPEALAELSAAG